jgi:hypothetical protein
MYGRRYPSAVAPVAALPGRPSLLRRDHGPRGVGESKNINPSLIDPTALDGVISAVRCE